MQAQSTKPVNQRTITDPSPFSEALDQEEPHTNRTAKKTGKIDVKIDSKPPDPGKFFNEYDKVIQKNKEVDWLNGKDLAFKQPKKKEGEEPKGNSIVQLPPFFFSTGTVQTSSQPQTILSNSSNPKPFCSEAAKNSTILQVEETLNPVEARQAELNKLTPNQKFTKAFQKMSQIQQQKMKGSEKTINNVSPQKKTIDGFIDLTGATIPAYKQTDPFASTNNEVKNVFTNPKPMIPPPPPPSQTPTLPINNIGSQNSNQQKLPTSTNPLGKPVNISCIPNQNPQAQGSYISNPILIGAPLGNPQQLQQQNMLNNRTINPIHNLSSLGQPNQYQSNNISPINFMNPQIQSSNANQFQQSNPNLPQNLHLNSHNFEVNQSILNKEEEIKSQNWIQEYKKLPAWYQYRAQVAQKMNKYKLDNYNLDVLTALTFQQRTDFNSNEIDKSLGEIIALGIHFDIAKIQEKQILSKGHDATTEHIQEKETHCFSLKPFLKEFGGISHRNFTQSSEKQIKEMQNDKQIMQYYEKMKNRTVSQFLEEYQLFQNETEEDIKEIAECTMKLYKKKALIEKLSKQCEMQRKRNQGLLDGTLFDKIQQRQEDIVIFLERLRERLNMSDEYLSKSDLYYEVEDLKKLEQEEDRLLEQLNNWRILVEGSRNGEPYKEVVDILCDTTQGIMNQISQIEENLLPALQEQIAEFE